MEFETITKNILPIVIGLIVIIIIGKLLYSPISAIFDGVGKKISPPKLTYDNTYAFNAQEILVKQADTGCTEKKKVGEVITELECKKDAKQSFSVIIANNAEVMRTYHGGIIVCEYGDKKCCDEATVIPTSSDDCVLKPGEKSECAAGIHTFDDYRYGKRATKYEVHPVADCVLEKTIGCYKAGLTSSIKSCNQAKSIIVTLI